VFGKQWHSSLMQQEDCTRTIISYVHMVISNYKKPYLYVTNFEKPAHNNITETEK